MKSDWLSTACHHWFGPRNRRPIRRHTRASRPASRAIEQLESRILLSVTSIIDTDVAFSTAGENLFKGQAVLSKNFDYTLIDESFGASIGGFTAGTGVKVSMGGEVALGLNGAFALDGGTVDIDYLTDVQVAALGLNGADINALSAGDHFTVGLVGTPNQSGISMATQITGLDFDLDAFAALEASIGVKAKIAGQTVLNQGKSWGVPRSSTNLFHAEADPQIPQVGLKILGEPIISDGSAVVSADSDFFDAFIQEVDRGYEIDEEGLLLGVYAPLVYKIN